MDPQPHNNQQPRSDQKNCDSVMAAVLSQNNQGSQGADGDKGGLGVEGGGKGEKGEEKVEQKVEKVEKQDKQAEIVTQTKQTEQQVKNQSLPQKQPQSPQKHPQTPIQLPQQKPQPQSAQIQRPISINIDKNAMQFEKQKPIFKQPEVKIEIKETMEKGFTLSKEVYFRIVGCDKHGGIDVWRKIGEFQGLRRIVLERWPGCFVPSLSQKSEARTQELRDLHRRKNLEDFIKKISFCEQIYYKEQVQLFLRCAGVDMEEMFSQMPILRVRDVMERFRGCYGEAVEQPNSPENLSTITKFSTSLKKIAHNLQDLAKRALKLAESYETYQESLPKFANFLGHYQQSCLSQYTNDPNSSIALRDTDQKLNKLKILSKQGNIFYDLYFLLDCQNRDAQSLSDVILAMQMFNIKRDDLQVESKQTRQQIDQISLGHKNLKLLTSRKPKQQVQAQLQQKQKQLIAQKHQIIELTAMSQLVLATITIPMFKKMKMRNYFEIVRKWGELVGDVNQEVYGVWKFLGEEGRERLKRGIQG